MLIKLKTSPFLDSLPGRGSASSSPGQLTSKEVNKCVSDFKKLSLCENFIIHCLIFSGIIDQAHLRPPTDKELTRTVTLESHYYTDHSSVNVLFKNLLS